MQGIYQYYSKLLKPDQWPSNVAYFFMKNEMEQISKLFEALPSQTKVISGLGKWKKIFFCYKIIANSYETLSTMVTPIVVPNLGMLSWILSCMWPFPCAYALKSTQVHAR